MKKLMKNIKKRATQVKTVALLSIISASNTAMAALPTAPSSNGTVTGSTYVSPIQNYILDGLTLLGILVGAYAFFRVAQNAIQTYGEISDGNGTYRDLGGSVIAGVVIASGVIWLLTNAMTTFS